MSKMPENILFVYTSLPYYMFRCIRELSRLIDSKIYVIETSSNSNYPTKFKDDLINIINYNDCSPDFFERFSRVNSLVFISGWANKKILYLANHFFKKAIGLILLNDQPIKNNLKQVIGRFYLQGYIKKFKLAIVSGKLAGELLKYYGINSENIKFGLYTADDQAFTDSKLARKKLKEYPKNFLFDGQLIERKGLPFLISEYAQYRQLSNDPWNLILIGKGSLEEKIPSFIDKKGFINPMKVPEIYANAGCFILPSIEDHWPLVIHQAACSGLPILLSKYCYNHYEFLLESKNGYKFDPKVIGSLSKLMLLIEQSPDLEKMGNVSFELSQNYSVDKWVKAFRSFIQLVFND